MRDEVAARADELRRARVPFVQATVVRAQHPTSAHAGDAALVDADGGIRGFVGGSCAQTAVRTHALEVLVTGEPLLLRIQPGVAATVREEGAVTVANPCLSGGSLEIFLEPRRPAPRLVVVGDTPIAAALVALAGPLGFAAERGAATPAPGDVALVVASHGQEEEAPLQAALRAGVPYVGLVASRTRGAAVLAALDVDDEQRRRVHTPAGLDIGARTAEEIALSILAEIIAERPRTPSPAAEAAPATAIDPVCGMTVPTVGEVITAERDGSTVYFCSPHCRSAFLTTVAG